MKILKLPKFNTEEFLSREQALAESKAVSDKFYEENEKEKAEQKIKKKYEESFGSSGS